MKMTMTKSTGPLWKGEESPLAEDPQAREEDAALGGDELGVKF